MTLIVIPRESTKKKTEKCVVKRNRKKFKWYTRKYLFTQNKEIIEEQRKKKDTIKKWQM